ncbi:MAG: glycosyl transferase [Saprospirales bacterium]|nr:MAG: glycosyl transferase [Saprospirales bacterium]
MKLKEIIPSLVFSAELRLKKARNIRENNQHKEIPVIVSLTSIPSRISKIHLTIRSLLIQSTPPKKIVLWLNEDLRNSLPKSIKCLESPYFEICFSPLNCSHRKLIHSIKKNPTAPVVTADDDCLYHRTWLENLYESHCKYPGEIIANMVREINYGNSGSPEPYKSWREVVIPEKTHPNYVQVGYAGVLYPINSLDQRVTDQNLFLILAPQADDLWFKMMAKLNGTNVRTSIKPAIKPLTIIGSQSIALNKVNVKKDRNRLQWEQLKKYFG